MGRKYKNLFEQIVHIDNLRLAYHKTKQGKRYKKSHLLFKEELEFNLFELQKSLIDGSYRHKPYNKFVVTEPKPREINALPFADRIIQHAINNILEPIFEKTFYPFSFACRKNKGTHKGVIAVQSALRRVKKDGKVFYLKMDFSKYFHSVDREILNREIAKKISDERVIRLLQVFELESKKGVPIGNLLSQLFANIYGHIFDRFAKTRLGIKNYFRYMDDTVVIANSKNELVAYQKKLKIFARLYMKLKFSKWFINPINIPLNFLGYRISPEYKLIRQDSVTRAKKKIKYFNLHRLEHRLTLFLASWTGHLLHSDSHNLRQKLNIGVQKC